MASDVSLSSTLRDYAALLSKPVSTLEQLEQILGVLKSALSFAKSKDAKVVEKSVFTIQESIINEVLPSWEQILSTKDGRAASLGLQSLFILDDGDEKIKTAIALPAYQSLSQALSNISSNQIQRPSVHASLVIAPVILSILSKLLARYPFQTVYRQLCPTSTSSSSLQFQQYQKSLLSIPAKISNLRGVWADVKVGKQLDIPDNLEEKNFWNAISCEVERIVGIISTQSEQDLTDIIPLFNRFHTLGLFPSPSSASTSELLDSRSNRPSFFTPTFPDVLVRLKERSEYGALWKEILDGLDSRTRIGIVHGFFFHLTDRIVLSQVDGEPQRKPEVGIKLGADLLIRFFGSNAVDVKDTIVDTLLPLVISKDKSFDVRSSLQQGSSSSSSSSWERMGVRARVFVAVVEKQGRALTGTVLKRVMEVWGDEREVRWGLLGRRSFLTLLIILLVSTLPPFDPLITQITFHSPFLVAMQSYLGHSDPAIRRLGMLIGEIISIMSIREEDSSDPTETKGKDEIVDELEGMLDNLDVDEADLKRENKNIPPPKVKRLDFGKDMWDGTGGGKEESRWLRSFFRLRDRNAIGAGELQMLGWQAGTGGNAGLHTSDLSYSDEAVRGRPAERQARRQTKAPKSNPVVVDSDDESLVGYSDSSPSSSRSPSPTPSYLEEVANDPMLNTSTRAKVQRPVYLIQLIELLKARTEPEKLEVGLRWGEELIRRKRNFGSELDENAEELANQALALSDPYDIEEFESRRQGITIALTACSPKIVAPTLIRLYFEGHYSLVQKSAILTGLSMGARECAQLAPAIESKQAKVDFPSKYLPQPLHARYASPADRQLLEANKMIETTTGLIANEALRRGRGSAEDHVPEYARQKQLRVKGAFTRGKVVDMDDGTFEVDQATIKVPPPKIAFKDIAAEYFILPMINRFLTYLQEETMREAQTHGRYTVGGTGMILSSLSVSQFLSTLAIMVHAARHSALYLSVICPEALELAVSVGSKLSIAPTFSPSSKINKDKDFEADVVGTALELALVSVDAAKELDGGRSLALDKSAVLMASAEWASDILQRENQGESTTSNTGGIKEGRVKKAAAGLLVLVTGIVEKMQGLMT